MHDLSLYLLELLENSVRAGATRSTVTARSVPPEAPAPSSGPPIAAAYTRGPA